MGNRARLALESRSVQGQLLRGLLFLHLLLSPLLFSSLTVEVFEFNKAMLLRLTALILAAAGLAACLQVRVRQILVDRLRQSPIHCGFALLVLSGLVSTLFSVSPHASLRGLPESQAGLLTLLSGAMLFFATYELCTGVEEGLHLLLAPVLATFVVASYALIQVLGLDPWPWQRVSAIASFGRCFATLGHANHLAGYLVLTFPLLVCFALRAAQQRRWRWLGLLLALMTLSCCILTTTLSRGAWIAFGCMLLALALGFRWADRRGLAVRQWSQGAWALKPDTLAKPGFPSLARQASKPTRQWNIVRAPACALVSALLVGALIVVGVAIRPVQLTTSLGARLSNLGSMTSRLHIWRAGMQMFADHSLVGTGLDTFQLAFGRYRTVEYMLCEWDTTPARAHNEMIHVLATQGILGGLALIALVGGAVLTGIRAWKRVEAADQPLVAALAAGMTGFLVHGCFSFTVVGLGTLAVTYLAVLARLGTSASATKAVAAVHRVNLGRWVAQSGVWAFACVLAVKGIVAPFAANCCCRAAAEHPEQAMSYLHRAVEFDPAEPLYAVRLCEATEARAWASSERQERRRLLAEARGHLQRAIALVPEDAYQHHNLGRLLGRLVPEGLASIADAFAELDEALRRDPRNAVFLADAADLALSLGDLDRVKTYAQRGIDTYSAHAPFLGHLGYLALLEKRYADAATVLEAALGWGWNLPDRWQAATGTCLASAYLSLHRYDDALRVTTTALTRADLVEAHVVKAQALEVLGRVAEAKSEYDLVLRTRADHPAARSALARMHGSPR